MALRGVQVVCCRAKGNSGTAWNSTVYFSLKDLDLIFMKSNDEPSLLHTFPYIRMMVQQPFWLEILSTRNFLGFDCKILRRSEGSLGHAACVRASAATWPSARMRFYELLLICTTAKAPQPLLVYTT